MALDQGWVTGGWSGSTSFTHDPWTGDDSIMGLKAISLKEMLSQPTSALPQLQANLAANWQGILVGSFFAATGWKVMRRVLRQPVNRINRDLFGKRGIIGNIGFKL